MLGEDTALLAMLKKKLTRIFKMTYMGTASLVLGMQDTRDREKGILTMSQEGYTKSMPERFGMSECKPLSTPGFRPKLSLEQLEGKLLDEEDQKRHQAITGSVMYFTQVATTSRMQRPSLLGLCRSLPRLTWLPRSTCFVTWPVRRSTAYKRGAFQLMAFSMPTGEITPTNGKSMYSYIMMMASAPVRLKVGLQTLTAMSAMEAELVAAALAMKETCSVGIL